MQHVDEGDLHAWLDGALDQLGEGRAAEVREHLRGCASCREELVAEETLRALADEVLALAVPRSIDAPPFETLVERARARPPAVAPAARSRLSRVTRMGWAASVVIALGAGWMARTLEQGPEAEGSVATVPADDARQPVAGPDEAQEVAALEAAAAPELLRVADMAGAPSSGSNVARPARADAPAPPSAGSVAGVAQRSRAELSAAPEKAAVSQMATAEVRSAAPPAVPATEASTSSAAGASVDPLRDAARPGPVVVASAAAPQVAAEQKPATTTDRPTVLVSRRPRPGESAASSVVPRSSGLGIQRGTDTTSVPGLFARGGVGGAGASKVEVSTDADIDEAVDLIVPDLPVLRVEWTEVSPGRPGLRVLQRLSPEDTLEVRFVRSGGAAADAVSDPLAAVVAVPLRAGWSQVVRVHRDGWLVARAPVQVEELEKLVNRAGSSRR